MRESTVTGSLVFPEKTLLPADARVCVRLVDTTAQDAASKVIAETILDDVSNIVGQGRPVPFALTGPEPPANADCAVEVHVDANGAGFDRFHAGDYLNAQRQNVLTYGRPHQIQVKLRQI